MNQYRTLKKVQLQKIDSNVLASLCIRVKNEYPAIVYFWQSIELQSIFNSIELVFLDSGSSDNTLEFLKQKNCTIYSIDPSEFSFGDSCNLITSLSNAEIVFLLSGHVILNDVDFLEKAVNIFRNANADAAYFRQVPNAMMGFSIYDIVYLNRRFPKLNNDFTISKAGVHSFSNAGSMIKREVWNKIQFDNIIASEDFFWAEKLLLNDYKVIYINSLTLQHSHKEFPNQIYNRVKINKIARYGNEPMYAKSIVSFFKIFLGLLLYSFKFKESFKYAKSHARAYL